MQLKYSTKIENNVLIVSREDGLTTLKIINKLSDSYLDNMDDSTLNPLIEVANEIQENINTGRVCFTLIGNDNVITFTDNEVPVLEGGIYLNNVKINNPMLKNVKLVDVHLENTDDLTINFSKIDGLFMETTEVIHLVCCYINDKFGLENTKLPLRFLMNKHVGQ